MLGLCFFVSVNVSPTNLVFRVRGLILNPIMVRSPCKTTPSKTTISVFLLQVEAGVRQIASMRLRLRDLEANLVVKPLHLPRLARRKANVGSLHEKLRLVHAVVRTQPTIQQVQIHKN